MAGPWAFTYTRRCNVTAILNKQGQRTAMTSIDFYILGQTQHQDRLLFACRLAERVYAEGRRVYVHVASEQEALYLDDLMWSYKPESFLPHSILGQASSADASTLNADTQVQIGFEDHPVHHNDVMINLVSPLPNFFSRFERVLEVVIQEEQVLQQTREHYKFYKDRGYEVTHRDLRG